MLTKIDEEEETAGAGVTVWVGKGTTEGVWELVKVMELADLTAAMLYPGDPVTGEKT